MFLGLVCLDLFGRRGVALQADQNCRILQTIYETGNLWNTQFYNGVNPHGLPARYRHRWRLVFCKEDECALFQV